MVAGQLYVRLFMCIFLVCVSLLLLNGNATIMDTMKHGPVAADWQIDDVKQ